jgi:hypothetical protein
MFFLWHDFIKKSFTFGCSLHLSTKRYMWSTVLKSAQEAVSNPQVQAVTVGVGGALFWKPLNYKEIALIYETAEAARALQEKIANAEHALQQKKRDKAKLTRIQEMEKRKLELEEARASHLQEAKK